MTRCPSCGKEIAGSGYEFGREIRTACYECSCGTRFYVDRTPKETYEKLGIKQGSKARSRHRKRFHCRVCNGVIVRKRSEKDELSALRRHYREAHQDLPLPHTYTVAECDLTKKQRDFLKGLTDYVRQLESIAPEVLREMKEKGFKAPNVEDQKPNHEG